MKTLLDPLTVVNRWDRWVPREEPDLEGFPELRSDGLCNINWSQWGQLPVMSMMGRIVVRPPPMRSDMASWISKR